MSPCGSVVGDSVRQVECALVPYLGGCPPFPALCIVRPIVSAARRDKS